MKTLRLWKASTLLTLLIVGFAACAIFPGRDKPETTPKEAVGKTALDDTKKERLERATKQLESGRWQEAIERLGRLKSELDAEGNDSSLVDLHLGRAYLGPFETFEKQKLSTSRRKRIEEAASLFQQIRGSGKVRDAAIVYGIVADHFLDGPPAWSELRRFESKTIPDPILKRDKSYVSPIIVRALIEKERPKKAVELGGSTYKALLKAKKNGSAVPINELLRLYLKTEIFSVAPNLENRFLDRLSKRESAFFRCAGYWGLIQKVASEKSSNGRVGTLTKQFSDISEACTDINESKRVAELSNKLALLGENKRLLLGAVVPLSGKNQSVGESVVESSLLAMSSYSEQKKRHLTMIFRDSKRSADALFQEFENRGVIGVVGPLQKKRAEVFARAAQEYGIPMITLTAKSAKLSEVDKNYVFRNFIDAPSEAKAAASVTANELEDERVAIVRPNIGYGKLMARVFKKQFERLGGTVVDTLKYDRQKSNYTKVAKKLSKLDFEAIFLPDAAGKVAEMTAFIAQENIWGIDYDESPHIVDKKKGKRRMVHYVGTSLWQSPSLRHASDYIGEAVIPAWFSPAFEEKQVEMFVDKFESVFGRLPGKYEVFTYDSVTRLRELVVERGMNRPTAIRHALTSPASRLQGVSGTTHFTAEGHPVRKVRFISPKEADFVRLPFTVQLNRKEETARLKN